jgi:predicted transcriptional regulator
MTLDEYLRQPGITATEFAPKAGLTEASVSRIRKGQQNISRDVIRRIVSASAGLVTAAELVFDHVDIDTISAPAASPGKAGEISASQVPA